MFSKVCQQLQPFAQVFEQNHKSLYLVGGAVRNLLLGRDNTDFDFTTDALPQEVQAMFHRVLPTGIQHGTVTVLFQGQSYEVTTFRVDGAYSDQRRPDQVQFTPSLDEDLKRRDFTINALALDLRTGQLFDPQQGQVDLEQRCLKAIGNPGQRFDEDALRILRLFRFASQLDFKIDAETLEATHTRLPALLRVSKERIREELNKTIEGQSVVYAWKLLQNLNLFAPLFPSISPRPLNDQELQFMSELSPDLRWSFWLAVASRAELTSQEAAFQALTFSKAAIQAIISPLRALPWVASPETLTYRAKAILANWDRFPTTKGLEWLRCLTNLGRLPPTTLELCATIEQIKNRHEPIFLSELAITGNDLIHHGFPPGPALGKILKHLQAQVWENPQNNQLEKLLQFAKELT